VSRDVIIAALMGLFGLVLAIHCPRAAWREFRTGVAEGRYGVKIRRQEMPVQFWVTVSGTLVAGVMGLIFVGAGCLFFWAAVTQSHGLGL